MEEHVVAALEGGRLSFSSAEAAAGYLLRLGITSYKPEMVYTPPPMSGLLVKAFSHVQLNGADSLQGFLDSLGPSTDHNRASTIFGEAVILHKLARPGEDDLSNEDLARKLYAGEGRNNKMTTINLLRARRPMNLKKARDIVVAANNL